MKIVDLIIQKEMISHTIPYHIAPCNVTVHSYISRNSPSNRTATSYTMAITVPFHRQWINWDGNGVNVPSSRIKWHLHHAKLQESRHNSSSYHPTHDGNNTIKCCLSIANNNIEGMVGGRGCYSQNIKMVNTKQFSNMTGMTKYTYHEAKKPDRETQPKMKNRNKWWPAWCP